MEKRHGRQTEALPEIAGIAGIAQEKKRLKMRLVQKAYCCQPSEV